MVFDSHGYNINFQLTGFIYIFHKEATMWANPWQGGGGWPMQQANFQAMPADQGKNFSKHSSLLC